MTFFRLIVLSSALSLSGYSADIAHWSAAAPEDPAGIQLLRNQQTGWTLEQSAGGVFAAIKPNGDYYHRASFIGKLPAPAPEGAWLTISYLDKGYGWIAMGSTAVRRRGAGRRPQDQWGIVRLNTGKIRRAVFTLPAGSAEVQVSGVELLSALAVTTTKPEYEAPPMVDPAFKLKYPLDLVTSGGADSNSLEELPQALARLRTYLPLVRAFGFNGVESYVKWNFVERTPGVFDWSYYDAVVAECEKYGLKWFPLLIVGSSYSMPEWFHDSPENISYECLEHGMKADIPTIFHEAQVKYVRRFLNEFGKHYGGRKSLLGVRLGPSANYGEAQYPATGNWGYKGRPMHTHIGYWVGDPYANIAFRQWLKPRYAAITDLNKAWGGTKYASFEEVKTFLPITALNDRMRQDFSTWYMGAMTEWCEKWARWAREALPDTTIYQSSGGWGAVEIGTDYIAHTKSMAALHGGIRLTNENDSYVNNFCVTRPAASAARFYGARFGTEPAGFSSVRGVMNRLFNIITNNGQHLFYYDGNLWNNDQSPEAWLKHAPLLDERAQPAMDVAVFYPDTANKLSDAVMRHLGGASFFAAAQMFRSVMDYDFMGEQMV
ncbi:MAG: beta-galactosidase, partial [Acidobacteria bacterium]|nr:beta-galactosidase [Acidobacteriota bacterium]